MGINANMDRIRVTSIRVTGNNGASNCSYHGEQTMSEDNNRHDVLYGYSYYPEMMTWIKAPVSSAWEIFIYSLPAWFYNICLFCMMVFVNIASIVLIIGGSAYLAWKGYLTDLEVNINAALLGAALLLYWLHYGEWKR